ncbi:MAG TPA: patatin-like phospholipase family protein [Thermoanaerobaculia bacterium]|nr:patatin-like phospholipase family protein [Thermoanaerobaculia bacterium]
MSIVLGGGGAKGFVHLGVLEAVAERECEIVAVYGTSIGAIIGALFAYHLTFDHAQHPRLVAQKKAAASVKDLLLDTSFFRFADINLSPFRRGFVSGKKFLRWLGTQLLAPGGVNSVRFQDLDLDLNITITNAKNGESVIASKRHSPTTFVSAAVRASMSIQGLFLEEIVDYNGQRILCWDGGVTGNCRFDLSAEDHPEALTIASSVTYRGESEGLPNSALTAVLRPLLVLNRSADFWLRQIESLTEHLLEPEKMKRVCIVRPDLAGVTTTDFHIPFATKRTLVENGRAATEAALRRHGSQL